MKTVWYCHKDRHIDQWSRIESPQIKPYTGSQLIFDEGAKTIRFGGKESFFQLIGLEQLDMHMQENKFGSLPQTICKN